MWHKLHLLNKGQCARIRTSFEKINRRLAQLVRALGRHPRGHQFESGTAYHVCFFIQPYYFLVHALSCYRVSSTVQPSHRFLTSRSVYALDAVLLAVRALSLPL